MATEIELKAWVDNPQAVQLKLDSIAEFKGSFDRADEYWFPKDGEKRSFPKSGLRIRGETFAFPDGRAEEIVHATFKNKELRDGIEVNDEREFDVSSAAEFEELLALLGLEKRKAKHKKGRSYKYQSLTAELTELMGLGWFAEIEILADNSRSETVAKARAELLGFLAKIGIDESKIETRYYTEMLASISPRA
ncbi:class IV adenylate cyclase [Leadbettera azotonutricia]|uniref:Putative adenylyl cyclase CyaB n=1 Tax=Leadbettera azotonutricia (strain ATCC BAA-888 / DSM 13862 / ZAS-9) TaxID=545695 RepID=F5Y8D0_LEAAZ|nr:class IV adenylate cyclase [Leadbettera azotonutricia]AEF81321.1 putative adenylyl cyclase CyaB [Leadbettera azotonutricia ZAS-9]